jgi:hypothetical protein
MRASALRRLIAGWPPASDASDSAEVGGADFIEGPLNSQAWERMIALLDA